jgi:hypothetical protein
MEFSFRMMGSRSTQQLPGIAMQRINKYTFARMALPLSVAVHATAPLSQTEVNPVGGAIARTVEARNVDQRFQQKRLDLIVSTPILSQLLNHSD